jgi:SAM-dependent methyltransferase
MINYTEILSKNYNKFHSRGMKSQNFQNLKIIHYLDLNSDSILLDAGCGAGRLFGISNHINKMIGVEKSTEMYQQAAKQNLNVELYNLDFETFLNQTNLKADSVLFSYTLHQFNPDKTEQIKILHNTFKVLKCSKILLITASINQFGDSVLNRLSATIDDIDRSRFLLKSDLESEFNILAYEEETIYNIVKKQDYKKLIENKYISTIQLLSDTEYSALMNNINLLPEEFKLPDYYTYILLEKL